MISEKIKERRLGWLFIICGFTVLILGWIGRYGFLHGWSWLYASWRWILQGMYVVVYIPLYVYFLRSRKRADAAIKEATESAEQKISDIRAEVVKSAEQKISDIRSEADKIRAGHEAIVREDRE